MKKNARGKKVEKIMFNRKRFRKCSQKSKKYSKKVGNPGHRKEAYQCNKSVIINKINEGNNEDKVLMGRVSKEDRRDLEVKRKFI